MDKDSVKDPLLEDLMMSFLLHHLKAIYGQSVAVMQLEQQANALRTKR